MRDQPGARRATADLARPRKRQADGSGALAAHCDDPGTRRRQTIQGYPAQTERSLAMLKILAAIAVTTGTPQPLEAHHPYRLPETSSPRPVAHDRRCSSTREVTVCAKRGDGLRLVMDGVEAGPPLHQAQLRIAPSRCANPVENGLRCIRPEVFARLNLDD
ncbi:hypothetical protein ACQKO5_13220 [Novosphingobium subterraneum]|uniref:hypothetical protein n=1 Tax=Novosphingobium subterraneum TaxID=48936 RepID=UPI003CFCF2B0